MAEDTKKSDLAELDPIFKEAIERRQQESKQAWAKFEKDVKASGISEQEKQMVISEAKKAGDEFPVWTGTKAAPQPKTADQILLERGETGLGMLGGAMVASELEKRLPRAAKAAPSIGLPPAAPAAPVAPTAPTSPIISGPTPPLGGTAAPAAPRALGTPGTYPTATGPGSATFNYARAYSLPEIEAAKALGTSKGEGEVWDLLEKRRQALTNIKRQFPTESYIENPRYGGIMTPDQGAGAGPRASYVDRPAAPGQAPQAGGLSQLPPRQPIPTAPQAPGALSRAATATKEALQTALGPILSSPKIMGALGGLGAVEQGREFMQRQEAQDYPGMAISGMGALGGAMQMLPFVPARAIGAGLSTASPALMYLYDTILSKSPLPATQEQLRKAAP